MFDSLFILYSFLYFSLFFYTTKTIAYKGSDPFVHLIFIDTIKRNNHKLIYNFPRVLDKQPLGYPVYLHKFLSYFSINFSKNIASIIINPLFNTLILIILYLFLNSLGFTKVNSLIIVIFYSLIPQLHHSSNTRLLGLTARSIGLFYFICFTIFFYFYNLSDNKIFYFLLLIFICILILGTSKFTQQSLFFIYSIYSIISNNYIFFLIFTISLLFFFLLHPKYSINYFIGLYNHYYVYATFLYKPALLSYRYSIWRDLFFDIWVKLKIDFKKGIYYIYHNSIIIILFLSPLFFVLIKSSILDSKFDFFLEIIFSTTTVFILTTFRKTRFLGEPERYIEYVLPFLSIIFYELYSNNLLFSILLCFYIIVNIFQYYFFFYLRFVKPQKLVHKLDTYFDNIINKFSLNKLTNIKLLSNNLEFTRFFFKLNWIFVYWWNSSLLFHGYHIKEIFNKWPFLNNSKLYSIINNNNIDIVIIDKSNKEYLYDLISFLNNLYSTLFEDEHIIIYYKKGIL